MKFFGRVLVTLIFLITHFFLAYAVDPVGMGFPVFSEPVPKVKPQTVYIEKVGALGAQVIEQGVLKIFPQVSVTALPESQAIVFKTDSTTAWHIRHMIHELDSRPVRIRLKMKVIEVTTSLDQSEQGLWSQLRAGVTLHYDQGTGKLSSSLPELNRLAFLINTGKAKILAEPTVLGSQLRPSTIFVGDRLPYVTLETKDQSVFKQVQYMNTGIELAITPVVFGPQCIQLNTKLELNIVRSKATLGTEQYPILSTRKIETVILVSNKQTAVIGGLLDERNGETESGVPFLKDLPVFGGFFRDKSRDYQKTDLLILLTPEIL